MSRMTESRHPSFPAVGSWTAGLVAGTVLFLLGGCFVNNTAPKSRAVSQTQQEEPASSVQSKPTAPSLELRFTPKQLIFQWQEVPGATHYRILENDGSGSGYQQLGNDITTTSYRQEFRLRPQGWLKTRYLLEACNRIGCSSSKEVSAKEQIHSVIGRLESPTPDLSDYFGLATASSADGVTLAIGAPGEDSDGNTAEGTGHNNQSKESGAVYVFHYDFDTGDWSLQALLKANPAKEGARFGSALAMSPDGNTLAVGAYLEGEGEGAVYLFTRASDGTWSGSAPLKATTEGEKHFGFSLALSDDGNLLAIGAPAEQGTTVDTGEKLAGAGATYLYARQGGQWLPAGRLAPTPAVALAGFGRSVALNGNGTLLAVGADRWSATPRQEEEGEGAVFLFSQDPETSGWTQRALVQATSPEKGGRFGGSVAISQDGTTLAVGAPRESGGREMPHAGAVYLFRETEGRWLQQHRIQAHNRGAHDEFGTALAFNRDASLLAVGAPFEDSSTTGVNEVQRDDTGTNSGAVYLYALTSDKWRQLAYIKPVVAQVEERSFGEFGTSVSLSLDGTILITGAPHLASRLLLTGEILETLNAPAGTGLLYIYSPPAMFM